jgi:tRNA threonylcarbamoyladenosine biosynthesis protein TsaB
VIAYPLLVLEAATSAGSVALFPAADRVAMQPVAMGASREDHMLPAIDALCRDAGIAVGDINRVVCGAGPGSFTSLRIAGSIAKGIVHANRLLRSDDSVALYAVSSLLLAAASIDEPGVYLVHSDAMRDERFVQRVDIDDCGNVSAIGETYRASTTALVIESGESAISLVNSMRASVFAAPAALADDRVIQPRADRIIRVQGWRVLAAVDLVNWEPTYGRLAEAQVKWEATHGTPLPASLP